MQKHNLKSKNRTYPKTVGRGGSRGKTSGRGMKGQKARAGHKIRPELRDAIKRMPKLRGRGVNIFQSPNAPFVTVRAELIEKNFEISEIVSPKSLVSKGIISFKEAKNGKVKIVAGGKLTKTFKIQNCFTTKSIEKNFVLEVKTKK